MDTTRYCKRPAETAIKKKILLETGLTARKQMRLKDTT